jgi:hypothetical protein
MGVKKLSENYVTSFINDPKIKLILRKKKFGKHSCYIFTH